MSMGEMRIPPQDLEAEQSLLGAMMLQQEVIPKVLKMVQHTDFYREANRKIFQAIESLRKQGQPADVICLTNELKRVGEFDMVGGVSTLTNLVERVPTAANFEYYALIVKAKSAARRVITAATDLVSNAYADALTVPEMIHQAKRFSRQVQDDLTHFGAGDDSPATLAKKVTAMLQASWEGKGRRFVRTGFKVWDRDLGGLERKKFHLITGQPGTGKSSLIQQLSYQMSINLQPVAYACLDTDAEEVPLRMVCQMVGVKYQSLFSGDEQVLSKAKRSEILGRLEMFGEFPLRIAGEGEIGRTFDTFASWAYRAVEEYQVQCIFLDSAAKFKLRVERGQTKEEAITDLVNDINSLAKDLDIPIVTIQELNRGDNPSPKGSGTWDYVARYWYHLERDDDDKDLLRMHIKKNNNGPTDFSMKFRTHGERFQLVEIDTKVPPPAAAAAAEEGAEGPDRRPEGKP